MALENQERSRSSDCPRSVDAGLPSCLEWCKASFVDEHPTNECACLFGWVTARSGKLRFDLEIAKSSRICLPNDNRIYRCQPSPKSARRYLIVPKYSSP